VSRRIWALSLTMTALVALGAMGFLSASASNPGGSGPSGAGGFHSHWGHGHEDGLGLGPLLHRLNLTDAQRTQIQTILSQERESAGTLFQQLHSDKAALSDKFFAPGALQSADLEPQVKQLAGVQQQLLEQRIQTAVAIRNVLSPEQLSQAAQLKSQIQSLREQMHNLLAPKP
jgi:Spy/CpxP family protein refolding chaperone